MSAQYFWELQSPPRTVRVRPGARWFFIPGLIWAAIIIGGVVGFVTWFLGNELKTLQRLEANGKFATAWVEKAKVVDEQRPLRLWGSPRVDAEYVFTVAGRTFAVHKDCGQDEFPSLAVRVLYWPNDPNVNLIRDTPVSHEEIRHAENWFWGGPKFGIALFAAFVIVIALPSAIVPGELNISRQFDLATRGHAGEALVTRLVRDSLGRCHLHYEFQTTAGKCRGKTLVIHWMFKQANPRVGQRLTVLFDPRKPRRNILVLGLDAVAVVDEPIVTPAAATC